MVTRYFGDVHGRWETFKKQMGEGQFDNGVQVGDLGVGFGEPIAARELLINAMTESNTKFIRGNHDNPDVSQKFMRGRYLGDWSWDETTSTLYIGGAWSIDRAWRQPYFDWWPEEELSSEELLRVAEVYAAKLPRVVVTHDGPPIATLPMFLHDRKAELYPNRTIAFLGLLFELHEPELWVFGHWHRTRELKIGSTQFLCVGQNTYVDL
jgi:predicted phosphodiesterase